MTEGEITSKSPPTTAPPADLAVINPSTVTISDIRQVEVLPPVPDARALEEQQCTFDHQRKTKSQEIGWIGRIVGDKNEKPGNIGFLVIALSFLAIVLIYDSKQSEGISVKEAVGFFTNLISLTLGYLYGQRDKS